MVTPVADGEMKMEIVQWSKFHTHRENETVSEWMNRWDKPFHCDRGHDNSC